MQNRTIFVVEPKGRPGSTGLLRFRTTETKPNPNPNINPNPTAVVKVRGNAVPGPLKIAVERSQAPHSRQWYEQV